MESNVNLDSIRELSNSQLEALLRFDSPPETPAQSTDLDLSKHPDTLITCDSIINRNREPFDSQIGSQIDFSVFNRNSSNNNWSLSPFNLNTSENDDCINNNSPLDTIEVQDVTMQEKDEHPRDDETFVENTFATTFCTINSTGKQVKNLETNICSNNKEFDFKEIDDIFEQIDFNEILNLPHVNNLDHPNAALRKCQTQFESTTHVKQNQPKVIASCPPLAQNRLPLPEITSQEIQRGDESPLKTINDHTIVLEDIFEKSPTDEIFSCKNSSKQQALGQNDSNVWSLFDEDSVKSKENQASGRTATNDIVLGTAPSIPLSVKQLYDIVKTNHSDFAFIYALSAQLCQDRVSMECFVTLKIALLLSLVSIGNNENRCPIPIVAITNDTYMTDYLMKNIGQLGSRFLGPLDDTKSFSSANWLEADPIILARGGVFYAGDWNRLKLRKAEALFKNIECSSIAVEKSSSNLPLETAIWTHWRSFKYGTKDQQAFNKFLKIFGIPIFVSDDNHEALVDYILDQASVRIFESTIDHLSINQEDMRSFLIYISQNNVELSPEAALLLKDYFVASRSMRQDCLSKQSYAILKQFAESFAKLSMRKVVLAGDAIAAIIMCEHFIENVFNPTDHCPPHFGKFDYVGAVDEYLQDFEKWLNSYIKKSKTKV